MVTAALWTDMAQNAVAFLFICYFWISSPDFLKLYVHSTIRDTQSVLEEQSDRKQPFSSNTAQICSNIKKSEVIWRMIWIVCCIISFSFPGRSCGILYRTHLNSWSNFPFLYLHKYEFIYLGWRLQLICAYNLEPLYSFITHSSMSCSYFTAWIWIEKYEFDVWQERNIYCCRMWFSPAPVSSFFVILFFSLMNSSYVQIWKGQSWVENVIQD